MEMKKVRLLIGGMEHYLTTSDDVEYLKRLGNEVDDCMTDILRENARFSVSKAAVISALRFADEMHKAQDATASLRREIQAYMEDASKAKTDAEISRREADRLIKEIALLRAELAKYKQNA